MPFDKLVDIQARGAALDAPTGSTWRTFGSPIGAGQIVAGEQAAAPPWPSDPDDSSSFRELPENPNVSIFACDDALLESWLDTQPDDRDAMYWDLAARKLSRTIPELDVLRAASGEAELNAARAAITAAEARFIGRVLSVRGVVFGSVISANYVARSSIHVENNRSHYDRVDLVLDRDLPRATFFDFVQLGSADYTVPSESNYSHAYLDPLALLPLSTLRVWAEETDYLSTDSYAVDVVNLETADHRIDLVLRVRHDDRITPFSPVTVDGARYNIVSVEREVGAGRRRYMLLRARRHLAA